MLSRGPVAIGGKMNPSDSLFFKKKLDGYLGVEPRRDVIALAEDLWGLGGGGGILAENHHDWGSRSSSEFY
jgi:hypothetical protein